MADTVDHAALDAAVARSVYGVTHIETVNDLSNNPIHGWQVGDWPREDRRGIPHYSTSITAAWQLVEHLTRRYRVIIDAWSGTWHVGIYRDGRYVEVTEAAAPLAICKATLAALAAADPAGADTGAHDATQ